MIVLGTWGGQSIALGMKTSYITVNVGEPERASVFSYDYEGRLWAAFMDETSYRRGLDGKILAKWRIPGGGRGRLWLQGAEALSIERRAREMVAELYRAIQGGCASLGAPIPEAGMRVMAKAIAFDDDRSIADAARYFQIYKPVGILPPDQYMAVVLQATEGCSFNTCTFCSFYRDRPFRIKGIEEFRDHARAVREFLGEGLSLRRTIFLGDANALVTPMDRLAALFQAVHEGYDLEAFNGIYAFTDGFSGDHKSINDYKRLKALGLKRVYIGMESGHDPLLRFVNKPSRAADVLAAVEAMKQAGIAVGVIVLLGAGGRRYAEGHVRDTIHGLNAMPLDGDDIIYFSELVVTDQMAYAQDAVQAQLEPLSAEERVAQGETIERGLLFQRDTRPLVSRYDIREFVY